MAAEDQVLVEHNAELVASHRLVAPGECSIIDEHYYGGRRRAGPS